MQLERDEADTKPEDVADLMLSDEAVSKLEDKADSKLERNEDVPLCPEVDEEDSVDRSFDKLLRRSTLSFEEPFPSNSASSPMIRRSKSVTEDEGKNIGDLMEALKTCEDFVSFKMSTISLLTRMNAEMEALNKRISQPSSSGISEYVFHIYLYFLKPLYVSNCQTYFIIYNAGNFILFYCLDQKRLLESYKFLFGRIYAHDEAPLRRLHRRPHHSLLRLQ